MTEAEWYKNKGCTHAHCINGCEDPHPALFRCDILNNDMTSSESWLLICTKCYLISRVFSEMQPCNCDNYKKQII